MGLNYNKKTIVGVSVSPEVGIEVALVDYTKRTLLNYISKPFVFDSNLKSNFDLDIFKETLHDALVEIGAPQGTGISLNLPSCVFGVKDWPAAIDKVQLYGSIEDEILDHQIFKDGADEPLYGYSILPNSTVQFNKTVHTAVPKSIGMEIAVQIKDLKYKLVSIDTSVNSTLNALMYTGMIDISSDINWLMLIVNNNSCRVLSMQGKCYVDSFEEIISIGKMFDEADNYSTVVNAVSSILKNNPTSLLYVISKTDIISAEKLSAQLSYRAQIVYQEDNIYKTTPFLNLSYNLSEEQGLLASLDVIGAAIKKNLGVSSAAQLNLFNNQLGDIYLSQTPPKFRNIEFSVENTLKYGSIIAIIIAVVVYGVSYFIGKRVAVQKEKIDKYNNEIAVIDQYLKEHEDVSTHVFSETDEVRMGLSANKSVYSYYTIVGTEIPKKLWLTSLKLGDQVTIEGQADNLESVYGFFRNIKDYNPASPIKLQKLGLAGNHNVSLNSDSSSDDIDAASILTSMNADFYEFIISDGTVTETSDKNKDNRDSNDSKSDSLPALEPLE